MSAAIGGINATLRQVITQTAGDPEQGTVHDNAVASLGKLAAYWLGSSEAMLAEALQTWLGALPLRADVQEGREALLLMFRRVSLILTLTLNLLYKPLLLFR